MPNDIEINKSPRQVLDGLYMVPELSSGELKFLRYWASIGIVKEGKTYNPKGKKRHVKCTEVRNKIDNIIATRRINNDIRKQYNITVNVYKQMANKLPTNICRHKNNKCIDKLSIITKLNNILKSDIKISNYEVCESPNTIKISKYTYLCIRHILEIQYPEISDTIREYIYDTSNNIILLRGSQLHVDVNETCNSEWIPFNKENVMKLCNKEDYLTSLAPWR